MDSLGNALLGIERGLEQLGRHRLIELLRYGLAAGAVESLLRSHDLPSDPAIETLYQWRNGTTTEGRPLGDIYIFPGYYFLPIEDAIANYEALVVHPRWQSNWLPVFANGGGDFYFVDLNQIQLGVVRHFRVDELESPIEFMSIEDMMITVAAAFERGVFFVDRSGFLEMDDLAFEAVALEINPHVRWWAD